MISASVPINQKPVVKNGGEITAKIAKKIDNIGFSVKKGEVIVNGHLHANCDYSFSKTGKTDCKIGRLILDIHSQDAIVYVPVDVAYPGAKMAALYGVEVPVKSTQDGVFSEPFPMQETTLFLRPQDKTAVESACAKALEESAEAVREEKRVPAPKKEKPKLEFDHALAALYLG